MDEYNTGTTHGNDEEVGYTTELEFRIGNLEVGLRTTNKKILIAGGLGLGALAISFVTSKALMQLAQAVQAIAQNNPPPVGANAVGGNAPIRVAPQPRGDMPKDLITKANVEDEPIPPVNPNGLQPPGPSLEEIANALPKDRYGRPDMSKLIEEAPVGEIFEGPASETSEAIAKEMLDENPAQYVKEPEV